MKYSKNTKLNAVLNQIEGIYCNLVKMKSSVIWKNFQMNQIII
jgi:hypothetical protein